jgi:hypothetical protein
MRFIPLFTLVNHLYLVPCDTGIFFIFTAVLHILALVSPCVSLVS